MKKERVRRRYDGRKEGGKEGGREGGKEEKRGGGEREREGWSWSFPTDDEVALLLSLNTTRGS